jgi:hypothetical protein
LRDERLVQAGAAFRQGSFIRSKTRTTSAEPDGFSPRPIDFHLDRKSRGTIRLRRMRSFQSANPP